MPVVRKLVAVVFADVVGYSRLMERDEAGTHARLRELRELLLDPKIAMHGGRTVHTSGDGTLIEFPSATSALRCAVEIQREMGARNLYVAPEERIQFRIGINLGDIIVDGEDIAGDGVNVAARLEAMSEPGGICVASAVWEQVHEDLGVEFVDAGAQQVKNISKPIRVYRVALGKSASRKATPEIPPPQTTRGFSVRRVTISAVAIGLFAAMGAGIWLWMQRPGPANLVAGPPPRSIMVLPFTAPADDSRLNALADRMGGDVARALANSLRDASIVAPSVMSAAKGKPLDERTLAREANVRYLVAGELRGAGDDIAATTRLIDGTSAKQLASERRTIAQARAIEDQDLLVARVTSAARVMFQNAEGRRIAAEPVAATDAPSLVARAEAIFTGEDLASTRAARKLFEQAIERDPTLVAAWIGHMYTLDQEHWLDFAAGRDERLLAQIDLDSRRAVALDDRDPEAWLARVEALADQSQWQAAFEASDRVLALDPSRFLSRAGLYIRSGRSAEALQQITKRNTMAGAPSSGLLFAACHAHVHLGQYEQAIADCERAVASDNFYWVYLDLTAAYAQTGDMTRAAAAKTQLMKRVPDLTISRLEAKQFSNNPTWQREIRENFISGLRKAGVPE